VLHIYLFVRSLVFTMINKLSLVLIFIFICSVITNILLDYGYALCMTSCLIKKIIRRCFSLSLLVITFRISCFSLHLHMVYPFICLYTNQEIQVHITIDLQIFVFRFCSLLSAMNYNWSVRQLSKTNQYTYDLYFNTIRLRKIT